MSLDKIVAISGKPGLFELKTQTRTGFVAQSLLDGKKSTVGMRSNVSVLSEIAIYTLTEEVPLRDVFAKIQEKENGGETSIGHKESKDKLEEYFLELIIEKTASFILSEVGRILECSGLLSFLPLCLPEIILISIFQNFI